MSRRTAVPLDRRGAEPLPRRGARRRHLLSRFQAGAGGPAGHQALPRRGLPGARRRCARPGLRDGRPDRGGDRLLPRPLRQRAHAMVGDRLFARLDEAGGEAADRRGRGMRVFVPGDAAALAVGADAVARPRSARASSATARAACSSWSRCWRSRPGRAGSAMRASRRRMFLRSSHRAPPIPNASAPSRTCRSSSARRASPSPAAVSPIRSRWRNTVRMAA